MSTLGEISNTTVGTMNEHESKAYSSNGLTISEIITKFVKENPDRCRNTSIKNIATKIHELYPDNTHIPSLQAGMSSMIRKGELLCIPNKGKTFIGTYVLPVSTIDTPLNSIEKVEMSTDAPTEQIAEKEEKREVEISSTEESQLVAMETAHTDSGVAISITLNINLNMNN